MEDSIVNIVHIMVGRTRRHSPMVIPWTYWSSPSTGYAQLRSMELARSPLRTSRLRNAGAGSRTAPRRRYPSYRSADPFATITQSIVADIAHAQHATRSSWMENQAASAGSAARQGTTTVGRLAVGLTTRPSRDSREHPNAAHLSHLQEATSISHSISSSGVCFTFGIGNSNSVNRPAGFLY
jgi:hypothetical protein